MPGPYPEFRLQLPYGGPFARGQQLDEKGTNGTQKFVVLAGSPMRREVTPSFEPHVESSARLRHTLIFDGSIKESTQWPGYLETTRDITCNSGSAAAEILLGRSASGLTEWKTEDGRPLGDFLGGTGWGPARSWLVRGSNVSGQDLARRLWLPEGLVSVAASRLRRVEPGLSKDELRSYVTEDYESAISYSQRQQLVDELHVFLSRMRPGDTVCTISDGEVFVGEIVGDVEQIASEGGRSNLRRPVEWQSGGYAYDKLPDELQQKLSIQQNVVDLTSVSPFLAGLGRSTEELKEVAQEHASDSSIALAAAEARLELKLPEPTQELADELLMHDVDWLREVCDLLWDEKQLIFYGPPGTGKTYLARALAEFLSAAPERVRLIQFHPSYAYEDFFEGFRPKLGKDSENVSFEIVAGPLRKLADDARLPENRLVPFFLIIDEINRANLAKVFGELYFLLEYRNQSVRLTYSEDDFALPPNLFIIGTMNTADRSIALVDAAMRRRFAFVELSPRTEPTSGLLRRWLAKTGKNQDPADLLDALNKRIEDPGFRVGPSYLMKPGVYRDGGLERTWRTKILPLLEEHYYGEGIDVDDRFGLATLRTELAENAEP